MAIFLSIGFIGIENNSYICSIDNNKTLYIVCLRYSDFSVFSFFFYSREHEPIHVHVEGNGGMAKYDWDGTEFVYRESIGIKANDLKKIKGAIDENADLIINHWNKHFNN